jgi:hypothetical protein
MSTMTSPGTAVNTVDLRPRRRWYAVAAVIAAVGVAVGVLVLLARVRAWTDEFPQLGAHQRPGQAIPVDLRAGGPVVLYVSPDVDTSLRCSGEVAGTPVTVSEMSDTFTFFSGGRAWAAQLEIGSDVTGAGSVTCTGSPTLTLAIGEPPDNGRLLRILGVGIGLSAVPAVLGLGGGTTLAVGVARRRRAHRRALAAGR